MTPPEAGTTTADLDELRHRLEEAEELLHAIRSGAIDTLVIGAPGHERIYTLQGAEYPYRVLVETMNEGAASLLPDGTVLYANASLARLLGTPLEELIGAGLDRWVAAADRPLFGNLLHEALHGRSRAEMALTPADGPDVPVLVSAAALDLAGVHGICLVVTDLTLQRRTEALEAQVQARTRALSDRNRELQSFAYVASHDLQEPLRKILTFSELLRVEYGSALEEQAAFYLDRVDNAAHRMSVLLHDLLAFSRVSTHTQPFEPVDLAAVVEAVLADHDLALTESGARFAVGPLPTVTADAGQIRQLLTNLVSNALKFRRDGVVPEIRIEGRIEGDSVHLDVADNGIGFDEKYADRIFEPFQRLHGRGAYPGTGMGLAICRRIVERHHGTLSAHSREGEGSTFTVTLPQHPPA